MLALALSRAGQVNANGAALVSDLGHVTWGDLIRRIERLAGGLHRMGVEPGTRVAVLATNSNEHLELIYAICWMGAVIVPLNTRLAVEELINLFEHSDAAFLAFDENMQGIADEIISRCHIANKVYIDTTTSRDKTRGPRYSELLTASPIPAVRRDGADLVGIFYTGGTTGTPKGVMISHGALAAQAVNMVHDTGQTIRTVHLHTMPLFHIASFSSAWAGVYAAAAQTCLAKFQSERVFEKIMKEGVNSLSIVPTMIEPLLTCSLASDQALERVESITYGAAPITLSALDSLVKAFSNARIQQIYGQTESAGACLTLAPTDHKPIDGQFLKLHTAGRSTFTYLVKIIDGNGVESPRGVPGEIIMSGPGVMSGYWRNEAQTAKTIIDGWLKTGDVGVMDSDGYVAIVDRLKDMIVTGGENVYSSEVENALAAHPAVAQCAVIGLPDVKWGEIVCAVVIRKPNTFPTSDELIEFCRGRIGGYKCPKRIIFRDDALPLSGIGKIQKNVLRIELS